MKRGATEFSIGHARNFGGWIQVQSLGFGKTPLVYRFAGSLAGPWSGPRDLYQPDLGDIAGLLIYAGKAHPHLAGADLVATYATNSLDPETLFDDDAVYYPRFVRVDFGPAGTQRPWYR
jgi:hypothetical protein